MLVHCENDKCKHYFEDTCSINANQEMISLDNTGKCITFEKGINEIYKNTDMDKRFKLSKADAINLLPDKEYIHTFRQSDITLIGDDWSRDEMMKAIDKYQFELAGEQASKMGHGMAFCDENGWVFVETK